MKMLGRIMAVVVVVALIVGICAVANIGNFNDTTYTITVTEKERTGGEYSKYLIFGEDENGNS